MRSGKTPEPVQFSRMLNGDKNGAAPKDTKGRVSIIWRKTDYIGTEGNFWEMGRVCKAPKKREEKAHGSTGDRGDAKGIFMDAACR